MIYRKIKKFNNKKYIKICIRLKKEYGEELDNFNMEDLQNLYKHEKKIKEFENKLTPKSIELFNDK